MLQTIEIEIDATGRIHPLEHLEFTPSGRALLTLLDQPVISRDTPLPAGPEIVWPCLLVPASPIARPPARMTSGNE